MIVRVTVTLTSESISYYITSNIRLELTIPALFEHNTEAVFEHSASDEATRPITTGIDDSAGEEEMTLITTPALSEHGRCDKATRLCLSTTQAMTLVTTGIVHDAG